LPALVETNIASIILSPDAYGMGELFGLRHTSATLLLSTGVHPEIVQERLGHSQISITLDTCSYGLPTMQLEAAEKLNRFLGSAVG
jgi:integrase